MSVSPALRIAAKSVTSTASIPVGTPTGRRASWWALLVAVWLGGCCWEAIRLLQLQVHLRRIARRAFAASSPVQALARQIQVEFNIDQSVEVRVSDAITSPFLCGVLEPTILIPRRLAEDLPPAELKALLSHELAHQCRHDLAWCIAWRLMRAVYWFHPLVWKVPDAHVLACEEEADRIAAARAYEGIAYPQLLAQLALRVLRVPSAESRLTLNAASHLSRRLIRLGRERVAAWRTGHSVVGFAVAVGLLVLTAGWQFAQAPTAEAAPAAVATASVLVTIQDEEGKPIEGATITPDGLRARGERLRSTGYGWRPSVHGPVVKAVTDRDGHARVTYPVAVNPDEKLQTGEISFTVDHPEFSAARPTIFVDGTAKPIRLKRGIPIRVSGYFGASREPVANIVPNLIGESFIVRPEDWQRNGDGSLSWDRMSPGKHFLQVSGQLASGEMVYSDGVAFFGEQRDSHDYVLEMKPGVRVAGHIDVKVPRPVTNGWVQLSVHDDEANTQMLPPGLILPHAGNTGFWFSYRPIAADGTFVFESVPRGELKVLAYGEGFISANGVEAPPPPPFPGAPSAPVRRVTRGVPQSFAAAQPLTTFEVATESTATLKVFVKSDGRPLDGAKVYIWPNMIEMPTGSRTFGAAALSSEEPFRHLTPPPEPVYSAISDKAGVAVLRNVPAFTPSFGVLHDRFEVPLQPSKDSAVPVRFRGPPNRYVDVALSPGQSTQLEVALQPKGKEFVGAGP